ncbi:hypothetical protein [Paeniglutamicibacter psychrophenolicus]|uniref:hypothetical protein n=1 Tax=Paeniglutamicibacter psychrophenolicus TaxID=257454 RepID=UPI00278B4D7E|nr:hypothetical protein [Paeniglutamicibacter psychrophenolicus]MDQ0096047.1 hypothetical protein [Paeniglutamicibacter psychrophenolicus]
MNRSSYSDTSTIRSRLVTSLVTGVASGALTLIDPAKLKPATRGTLYAGTGIATATLGWFGLQANAETRDRAALRTAVALGLGTLSAAGTKFGFVIDARIHQALLRRGIRNPRPVMAIGAGVLTTMMVLFDSPPAGKDTEQVPDLPEEATQDPGLA